MNTTNNTALKVITLHDVDNDDFERMEQYYINHKEQFGEDGIYQDMRKLKEEGKQVIRFIDIAVQKMNKGITDPEKCLTRVAEEIEDWFATYEAKTSSMRFMHYTFLLVNINMLLLTAKDEVRYTVKRKQAA